MHNNMIDLLPINKYKYKYAVFDLDGTLLNKNNKLSEDTLHQIYKLRELGIVPIIATGRTIDAYKNLMFSKKEEDIFYPSKLCHDGNVIINDNSLSIISKIDQIYFTEILKIFRRDCDFIVIDNGFLYSSSRRASIKYSMMNKFNTQSIKQIDFEETTFLNLTNIFIFPKNNINHNKMLDKGYEIEESKYFNCLRIKPKINKAEGVQYLLKRDFNENNMKGVISFGDGKNDVELLKKSQVGISVMDSHPETINASNIHLSISLNQFLEKIINGGNGDVCKYNLAK